MQLPEVAQRLYKGAQLLFQFGVDLEGGTRSPLRVVVTSAPRDGGAPNLTSPAERPIHLRRRDPVLESQARKLLRALDADKLAREVRVEWNPRLKTCAGRADYREKRILLNPLLLDLDDNKGILRQSPSAPNNLECNMHSRSATDIAKLECLKHSSLASDAEGISGKRDRDPVVRDEIDRTLRHELAHLLAQWRVGRRRIAPHGEEWRQACRDLRIADEARCHNLPFASKSFAPRFVYRCPNCRQEFPRVRKIRRAIACLACCRKHNGGDFDPRFRLRLCGGGL